MQPLEHLEESEEQNMLDRKFDEGQSQKQLRQKLEILQKANRIIFDK